MQKLDISAGVMLHSVEEAINWFANNIHPDLIFLDIQLSDGLSFEIFDAVSIDSAVIFTTAYDEYALKAFKLNSIDYLLKPIDEEELEVAVNKFRVRQAIPQNTAVDYNHIREMLAGTDGKSYKTRFTIKMGQHLKMINIEDVECFYSENKGTYLHTNDNRSYLLDLTLEQVENDLNPKNFFRVSRKHIIAIKAIKDIVVYSNSRLKIILPTYKEDEVIVSRDRVGDFKQWLG